MPFQQYRCRLHNYLSCIIENIGCWRTSGSLVGKSTECSDTWLCGHAVGQNRTIRDISKFVNTELQGCVETITVFVNAVSWHIYSTRINSIVGVVAIGAIRYVTRNGCTTHLGYGCISITIVVCILVIRKRTYYIEIERNSAVTSRNVLCQLGIGPRCAVGLVV